MVNSLGGPRPAGKPEMRGNSGDRWDRALEDILFWKRFVTLRVISLSALV